MRGGVLRKVHRCSAAKTFRAVAAQPPAACMVMRMRERGQRACRRQISRAFGVHWAAPVGRYEMGRDEEATAQRSGSASAEWTRSSRSALAARWIALLGLCSAYLQGGLAKALDFNGAVGEMAHAGLAPAGPFAAATIVLELAAPLAILTGRFRWLGALALAAFTLMATFLVNRFWEMAPPNRMATANALFEHLGLVGGFLLVAWHDFAVKRVGRPDARPD